MSVLGLVPASSVIMLSCVTHTSITAKPGKVQTSHSIKAGISFPYILSNFHRMEKSPNEPVRLN